MSKDLAVTWVQQERLYFCGPAVAQMAVTSLGAPSPRQPPTWQEQLWDEIQTETDAQRPPKAGDDASVCPPFPEQKCEKYDEEWCCWSTTPDALQRVLCAQQSKAAYVVSTHDDEDGATAELVKAVDNGVPGIALVYGWQHWVVVDGYLADAAGTTTGICLRDPFDAKSGTIHDVSLADWKHDYLSFVPAGTYRDKIVVIGGVIPAAAVSLMAPQPQAAVAADGITDSEHKAGEQHGEGAGLISADLAVRIANEEVKRLLTQSRKRWSVALMDVVPERSAMLLERLDRHDAYDYIVTYRKGDRVTARLLIDARTGRFSQAAGTDGSHGPLTHYVDPARVLEGLFGRSLDPKGVGGRVVRPETVGKHPVLVWRPCRQSMSPSLPFYQFSIGDRFAYLRVDGVWFDQLTSGPA